MIIRVSYDIKQRTVIKMKNVSKILCVVLALVMALSAASCSLSQQYAYNKDNVEIPIGVYVYYLQSAYSQAQSYAQKSDKYDSSTGRYDGKKSFLKMEITDDDGKTAIAEDWIKEKAKEETLDAVAVMTKFNELGCTMDEAKPSDLYTTINPYASYYGYDANTKLSDVASSYEEYGIGFDSWLFVQTLSQRENIVFEAEYGKGGPSEVGDEELSKYFTDNYTSYNYFSVNLYDTVESTPEDGSSETESTSVPLSEKEIADYQKEFSGYAETLSGGGSFSDVLDKYMKAHDIENDPSVSNVSVIDEENSSEVLKAIAGMKDGESMTIEIGDTDETKQLYLLYREPIKNQLEAYTDPNQNRSTVLYQMKHEDFHELLEKFVEDNGLTLSSDCDSYSPSMFEQKKK